jgi:hypothetical protein
VSQKYIETAIWKSSPNSKSVKVIRTKDPSSGKLVLREINRDMYVSDGSPDNNIRVNKFNLRSVVAKNKNLSCVFNDLYDQENIKYDNNKILTSDNILTNAGTIPILKVKSSKKFIQRQPQSKRIKNNEKMVGKNYKEIILEENDKNSLFRP